MLLLLSRKEVVKLQLTLCDFALKFQVSRRACYSFLERPNLVICPWKFANSCKGFGGPAKENIFSQLPIDVLSGPASYEGVWRCPINLLPHNCRLFLNLVLQRWQLKTTGEVSLVQFSCTKKLLMKLEVNQCYHAFQEDFII